MRNETSFLLGVSQKTQEMRDGKRGKGKSIADRSKDPRVESFSSTYFCKQVKDNKGLKGRVARISYVWFTRDKCLGWLKPWQHIYCYFVNFLKINFKLLVFTSFVSISHWLQVQHHPVKHLIDYRWPVVMWAWLSVVIGNTCTSDGSYVNDSTWFPVSVSLVHIVRSPRLDSQLHPLPVAELRWLTSRRSFTDWV